MNKELILFAIAALPVVACAAKGGYEKMLNSALGKKRIPYISSDRDLAILRENGFLVKGSYMSDIYEIYDEIADVENLGTDGPVFITADLYLHSLHRLIDYTMRLAEVDYLLPRMEKLSGQLLEISVSEYKKAKGDWKKPWLLNAVYFAVPIALFGKELPPLPKEVQDLVKAEKRLIEAAGGIAESPAFGTETDYSQFIPRGHYTVSEELSRYFLAMMWFGRMGFSLKPYEPVQARAALLQAYVLGKNKDLLALWQEMERVIALFSGHSDDLSPADLISILGEREPAKLDEAGIKAIADTAAKIKPPRILSGMAYSLPGKDMEIPITYRLMGQRSVADAYILQELIYDRVKDYTGNAEPFTMAKTQLGPQRCFARGLDVMAALGSDAALEIIGAEGDADYTNYEEQMAKLRSWWENEPKEGNVYLLWLGMLSGYLREGKPPSTVNAKAWEMKTLLASLGSWAQLRHDFILYAKQPYVPKAGASPPEEAGTKEKLKLAYIEDAGALFSAGAKLAGELAKALAALPEVKEKCSGFAALSDSLAMMAEKQKRGLSKDDHLWLWGVPDALRSASRYDWETMDRISDYDERFPLVADVLTDLNTNQCLEVGVGEPAWIGVLVLIDGKPYIAEGAVFSYYEFKQPISQRLTDEDWWYWDGERPGRQRWLERIGDYR